MAKRSKPQKKVKREIGRPSFLSRKLTKSLFDLIRAGNYVSTSCHALGIEPRTLYEWSRAGRRALEAAARSETGEVPEALRLHVEFHLSIQKAIAEAEATDVATIRRASKKHWQASAWRLERKMPKKWALRRLPEAAGAGNTDPQVHYYHPEKEPIE